MATLSIEVKCKGTIWFTLLKIAVLTAYKPLLNLFVGKPLMKMYIAGKINSEYGIDNNYDITEL